MKISAIVLAAGNSARMGRQKLLIPWAGEPMIRRVVRQVGELDLNEVLAVLSSEGEAVRAALEGLSCRIVENVHADRGMASSISTGIHEASRVADAYLILLGDMPKVSTDLLRAVVAQAGTDRIVVPRCGGREGNPVAFGAAFREALLSLRGDQGARSIIDQNRHRTVYVDWPDEGEFDDIDVPSDLP